MEQITGYHSMPLTKSIVYKQDQVQAANGEQVQLKDGTMITPMFMMRFGDFYLLPEGGTNQLAVKGTSEILTGTDIQDYICCAVGTVEGYPILLPIAASAAAWLFIILLSGAGVSG